MVQNLQMKLIVIKYLFIVCTQLKPLSRYNIYNIYNINLIFISTCQGCYVEGCNKWCSELYQITVEVFVIFFPPVLYKWEHYNLCKSRIIAGVTIAQHYKSIINSELNAHTAHLCICANHSTNLNYKIKIAFSLIWPLWYSLQPCRQSWFCLTFQLCSQDWKIAFLKIQQQQQAFQKGPISSVESSPNRKVPTAKVCGLS